MNTNSNAVSTTLHTHMPTCRLIYFEKKKTRYIFSMDYLLVLERARVRFFFVDRLHTIYICILFWLTSYVNVKYVLNYPEMNDGGAFVDDYFFLNEWRRSVHLLNLSWLMTSGLSNTHVVIDTFNTVSLCICITNRLLHMHAMPEIEQSDIHFSLICTWLENCSMCVYSTLLPELFSGALRKNQCGKTHIFNVFLIIRK